MRPSCKICGRPAMSGGLQNGKPKWKTVCACCHDAKHKAPWKMQRGEVCEFCGFIPVNPCQLDVDHKNGDKEDNSETNLQTLCANCHRLKTLLNKDWCGKVDK
jgi:cytochrome c553